MKNLLVRSNSYIKIVEKYRIPEIFLMTGFIIIGTVFSLENPLTINLKLTGLLFIGSFALTYSIYSSNSFLGMKSDLHNKRLKHIEKAAAHHFLISSIISLVFSVLIFQLINSFISIISIIVFILWIIYSVPKYGFKSIPILGSIIHFISQLLYFHIGYLVHNHITIESIQISIYFSLLFTAGHLIHEAIDYETDKNENILTGAVAWGVNKSLFFSHIIFLIAAILLSYLYIAEIITTSDYIPFLLSFILQTFLLAFFLYKKPLISTIFISYRNFYRCLYLFAGVATAYFRLTN